MYETKYVLISSARNEESYIKRTIESVISQTILPQKWIIVSDGSTDRTADIIEKYSKDYNFIELKQVDGDSRRNFGSQVRAFNTGYRSLHNVDYKFIGNLDADISFDSTYFECILKQFQQNPNLGLAGGFIYERNNEIFKSRPFNRIISVPHAVQLFRRECFEQLGGYIPLKYGGPDWYAEVMVRKNGRQVRAFPKLKVLHYRRTSSAGGILRGKFNLGLKDFSLGTHPLFEIFKCIIRIAEKPYFIGAVLRLMGFIWLYVKNEKRPVSMEFIKFLRQEQLSRLRLPFSKFLNFNKKLICNTFAKFATRTKNLDEIR